MYKNKEWLQQQLLEIGNLKQIGDICNVSGDTINYWRKKFNLPKPNKGIQVNRRFTINENYFEKIDNEHKAYWLGFIMADGCITRTEKNGPYNRFEINLKNEISEKHLLEQFNKDLNSNYEIKVIKNKNTKKNFETEVLKLRISCKKFVDNLILNGVSSNKTGKEILPNTIPKEFIKDFIRGYFDGDGSLTINKSFRICSSSVEILNSFNDFFKEMLGLEFKIYENKNYSIPFFTIDSNNHQDIKKVLDLLYKNSTIFLERKYERYISMYCSPIQ